MYCSNTAYKVNPSCDFPHVCSSKIKRPIEVKGRAYTTYLKINSRRAVTEDEFVRSTTEIGVSCCQ